MPGELWITREGLLVDDNGKDIRDFHQDRRSVRLVDFLAELIDEGHLTLEQVVDASEERRRERCSIYRDAPLVVPASRIAGSVACSDVHGDCPLRKIW